MTHGRHEETVVIPKFTNKLHEVRVQAGLTIAALARRAYVSDRTIRDIERGQRHPMEATLHRILNAINDHLKERGQKSIAFEEVFPS